MKTDRQSLRTLVNDWFGRAEACRVTRPSRTKTMPWHAVKVEVARRSGPLAIIFFRHDDGSWCVYLPSTVRPAMNWLCGQ